MAMLPFLIEGGFEMQSIIDYESFGEAKTSNGYNSYYARKKGRGHVANGTPCQDYCLIENIRTDIQVVAIADGHGGEAYVKSHIGSKMACELLYDFACEAYKYSKTASGNDEWLSFFLNSDFKRAFISTWKSKVLEHYKESEQGSGESDLSIIRKYGTTLIFAIFTNEKVLIGQLGDGAVLLFDKFGRFQLFKRHEVKLTSSTSSLVSGRAEYAFITDCYDRYCFPYVLLSTDGIYDKLDTSNAFYIYGKYLVNQVDSLKNVEKPFNVDDNIDVSEITKDDCTIVLVHDTRAAKHSFDSESALVDYENVEFYRKIPGLEIYRGERNGAQYILHLTENTSDISVAEKTGLNTVNPVGQKNVGNKKLLAYPYQKGQFSIKELIEMGEHLEKRYDFNKSEPDFEDAEKEETPYSNKYWMSFFERLIRLRNNLVTSGLSLKPYAFECAFLSDDGELTFYSDAFDKLNVTKKNEFWPIECVEGYFSIIGKIKCGDKELPCYKCSYQGQNIDMLHIHGTKKSLGRVIYNSEKKIYGLWNTSGIEWVLMDERKKSVSPQGVLRLNRNYKIFLPCEDLKQLADGVVEKDGFVEYDIIIYSR